MNTRKEYNDRWNAPLVNPPVTYGDWEERPKDNVVNIDNLSPIDKEQYLA